MLARKSFLQFLSGGTISLLGLVSIAITARFFGATALGTIGYAMGLAGLFLLASDLGFGQAHQKRVSEGQDLAEANGTFYTIKAVLLGISALALVVFLGLAAAFQWEVWTDVTTRTVFLIIALTLFLTDFSSSISLTAQARQEVARYNFPQIFSRLLKLLGVILAAFLSLGAVGLAGTYLLEAVVLLLTVAWLFRSYPIRRGTREMFRKYWSYSMPFLVMTPISLLAENIDKVMLKSLAGLQEVGYYVAVQGMMAIMPLIFSKPAMSVFFPHVSSLSAKNDFPRIQEGTNLIVRYLSIITLPIVVLLMVYRRELVRLLLGSTFLPAATVFLIAAVTVYVITIVRPYLNVLYGIERHHYFPHVSLSLLVVTILGYLFFVPESFRGLPGLGLGAAGVALTVLIVWVLDGIIKVAMLRRYTGISFYWRVILHLMSAALFFGIIKAFEAIVGHTMLNPGIVLGLIAYLGLLWLTKELQPRDLQFIRQVLNPRELKNEVVNDLRMKKE